MLLNHWTEHNVSQTQVQVWNKKSIQGTKFISNVNLCSYVIRRCLILQHFTSGHVSYALQFTGQNLNWMIYDYWKRCYRYVSKTFWLLKLTYRPFLLLYNVCSSIEVFSGISTYTDRYEKMNALKIGLII